VRAVDDDQQAREHHHRVKQVGRGRHPR
jgi:hypothetical protein